MSPLSVGVCCFSSYGGSGIMATELGRAMAQRGHRVHIVASELPQRLDNGGDNITFHAVEAWPYAPLQSQYALALAAKLVEVSRWHGLDLVHAHYAVPHAVSAVLGRQLVEDSPFKVVTTLHGTDVTSVDPESPFAALTRYTINQSDAVTVPSAWLRDETCRRFGLDDPDRIEVVHNFVDSGVFAPSASVQRGALERLFAGADGKRPMTPDSFTCVHVSNHRPVKRVQDVVTAFAHAADVIDTRLVMIGDGPDRSAARALATRLGVCDRVAFIGKKRKFVPLLAAADLFLLTSESESFGLAALEAQSCGVPVVASRIGGLPEVVADRETGLLCAMGDPECFARAIIALATDPERRHAMGIAARERALALFQPGPLVDRYEAIYRQVAAR